MLTSVIFAACSSDDETDYSTAEKPIPVVVKVGEEPILEEGAGARTRTVPITTETLNNFYMEYNVSSSWNQSPFTKNNGEWTSNLTWPNVVESAYPLTFYAYRYQKTESEKRLNYTDDANKLPYITVTTDENIAVTKDVLVAKSREFTSEEDKSSATVNLTFKHICSAVRFTICKTSGMSDYTIEVNSIKLCNVVKEGDYYYNNDTWTLSSTKTDYTLNSSAMTLNTDPVSLTAAGHYHFLLPQTLTAWDKTPTLNGTYLELECKISKGGNYKIGSESTYGTAYLPVGGTIEQGIAHTINLKVGTALRNSGGTQITQL